MEGREGHIEHCCCQASRQFARPGQTRNTPTDYSDILMEPGQPPISVLISQRDEWEGLTASGPFIGMMNSKLAYKTNKYQRLKFDIMIMQYM